MSKQDDINGIESGAGMTSGDAAASDEPSEKAVDEKSEHGSSSAENHGESGQASSSSEHRDKRKNSSSGHHSSGSGHSSSGHRSGGSGHSSSGHHSGGKSRSHSGSGHSSSGHHSSHGESELPKHENDEIGALISKYQVVADPRSFDNSESSKKKKHRSRKRRGPVRKTLTVIIAFLLVIIIGGTGTLLVLNGLGKKSITDNNDIGIKENEFAVTYDEGSTLEYNGKKYALNKNLVSIACMGVDKEELGLSGGTIGTAGQADTIMVFVFDISNGESTIISIPRDSMVDVNIYDVEGGYAGVERLQICLSYAYGDGTEKSCTNVVESIQRLLYGMPINLYAAMDLNGIAVLNDAIGGVTLEANETFGNITAGETITLYDQNAVNYVRYRDTTNMNSDSLRRSRQIQYAKAFVNKAIKASLKNFGVVPDLYNAASSYSYSNVTISTVTYLATRFLSKGIDFDNVRVLGGELVSGDPYSEYIIDEQAAFETVIDVFYNPVEE